MQGQQHRIHYRYSQLRPWNNKNDHNNKRKVVGTLQVGCIYLEDFCVRRDGIYDEHDNDNDNIIRENL